MQLAQMESTDITAAVHQDFTGHSVKRLKACLVHQVCRDVYRILMTCSESASFLLQSEVSWRWAWPFNILESFRLDINYRLYCSCASGFHGTLCEKIEAFCVQQLCRYVKDISYDLHENDLYGSLEFSNRHWWFFERELRKVHFCFINHSFFPHSLPDYFQTAYHRKLCHQSKCHFL